MNQKLLIIIFLIVIVTIAISIILFIQNNKKELINIDEENNKKDLISINEQNDVNTNISDKTINQEKESNMDTIQIKVNNKVLSVKLENNSSTKAFIEKLREGDIIVNAHDYGNFEKVGDLGFNLPNNDKKITTEPGDLILYQGNQITLYYDTNTWSFTKLGKVQNVSQKELKQILGDGDITLIFTQK